MSVPRDWEYDLREALRSLTRAEDRLRVAQFLSQREAIARELANAKTCIQRVLHLMSGEKR